MKSFMSFLIIAIALPLASFNSYAGVMTTTAKPKPIPNQPGPRPGKPNLSYWKAEWDRGVNTSIPLLTGTWRVTALVTSVACAYNGADFYDETGMTNDDGSYRELKFDYTTHGGTGAQIFAVWFFNYGSNKADQGPYEVDAVEPQFAQFGYLNGEVVDYGYFEYSCRLNSQDNSELICMLTLRNEQSKDACVNETSGLAYVFKKL